MCISQYESCPGTEVWVETGGDRIRVDEIEDKARRGECRAIEARILDVLHLFRCPFHKKPAVDVVIVGSDSAELSFDVYGCCPEFEAAARTRLLSQTTKPLCGFPRQLVA
ncbi:MAG: hypothetical protein HZA91_06985 [Verrucomicrobia bacterium]|nr:hypothetical protein [Verrucomicrobiota bacterium]